ncbi:hypothetical protein RJ640_010649 [Escallonia rubra]|uniref:Terpene synthase N-terminal domain-containing protein n=1 Tax=Escallonia rubra TaxID=112253 RepID=A0AA88QRX2_9ASTE|nr:hypothetical protein RJ640_010649 [Escallonia rubra]
MALKLLYTLKELSHQSLLWVGTSSGARISQSVRCTSVTQHSDQAILVDTIERLGVCHHFENEMRRILESIYDKYKTD